MEQSQETTGTLMRLRHEYQRLRLGLIASSVCMWLAVLLSAVFLTASTALVIAACALVHASMFPVIVRSLGKGLAEREAEKTPANLRF
jgi:Na+(H+)/acetate symporter ActP